MRLGNTFSAQGYFPFLVGHWKYSERFSEDGRIHRGLYSFTQTGWKKSERLVLQTVPDKFLHKKIINRDVYVDYGSTEDIPEKYAFLRLYGDLTALKWSRWLKF